MLGHPDAEVPRQPWHAQLLDALRLDEFEGSLDDLLSAQRTSRPTG